MTIKEKHWIARSKVGRLTVSHCLIGSVRVCFGSLADMKSSIHDVYVTPASGHGAGAGRCRLSARRGHWNDEGVPSIIDLILAVLRCASPAGGSLPRRPVTIPLRAGI